MNKYALIGFLLCLAGGVIIGFQKIGEMMEREDQWDTLSIDGMLTEEHLNAIQGMDAGILKDTVDFLITSPPQRLRRILVRLQGTSTGAYREYVPVDVTP